MTKENMDTVCALLKKGGCRSVHIGGGEPFLDFDGLLTLIKTAHMHGINVEYIETNGYWAKDEALVKSRLAALLEVGADTFCISVDPFHAEYVPFASPLNLAKWCREFGFGYFLWQERFLGPMKDINPQTIHNRHALEKGISPNYINETAKSYGLRFGGRAINIEEEYTKAKPLEHVLNDKPCRGLLSTNHFHVDMHGCFIPPGCTGIIIPLDEGINGIPSGKYPAFEALLTGGVTDLLDFARTKGFVPNPQGYTSSCVLCFHIRHWLSQQGDCLELDYEHYKESLMYY